MNKENFDKHLTSTIDNIKQYLNLKTELYTLIIFEKLSKVFAKFLFMLIFVFFLFFFLLFISLGFVKWFQEVTETTVWGYLIVSCFYLLLGIIIFTLRKRLFLDPILKVITDVVMEQEDRLDFERTKKSTHEED